jgi:hypothetical protein
MSSTPTHAFSFLDQPLEKLRHVHEEGHRVKIKADGRRGTIIAINASGGHVLRLDSGHTVIARDFEIEPEGYTQSVSRAWNPYPDLDGSPAPSSDSFTKRAKGSPKFKAGMKVRDRSLGKSVAATIEQVEGERVHVKFADGGSGWYLLEYAEKHLIEV